MPAPASPALRSVNELDACLLAGTPLLEHPDPEFELHDAERPLRDVFLAPPVRLQIPEDSLGVVDAPLPHVAAGQKLAHGRVQLRCQPLLHRRRKPILSLRIRTDSAIRSR